MSTRTFEYRTICACGIKTGWRDERRQIGPMYCWIWSRERDRHTPRIEVRVVARGLRRLLQLCDL